MNEVTRLRELASRCLVLPMSKIDLHDFDVEVIIDGRNCLDGEAIRRQNVLYRGIGR